METKSIRVIAICPFFFFFFFFFFCGRIRVFPNLLPLPGIWKKLAREKICGKKLGTYLKCLCFGIFPKEVCSLFWIAPIIQIKQFSGIFIFTDVGYRAPAALPVPTSFYRQTLGPLYLTLTGFDQNQGLVHFVKLTPPQNGRIPEMQMPVFSGIFMFSGSGRENLGCGIYLVPFSLHSF